MFLIWLTNSTNEEEKVYTTFFKLSSLSAYLQNYREKLNRFSIRSWVLKGKKEAIKLIVSRKLPLYLNKCINLGFILSSLFMSSKFLTLNLSSKYPHKQTFINRWCQSSNFTSTIFRDFHNNIQWI